MLLVVVRPASADILDVPECSYVLFGVRLRPVASSKAIPDQPHFDCPLRSRAERCHAAKSRCEARQRWQYHGQWSQFIGAKQVVSVLCTLYLASILQEVIRVLEVLRTLRLVCKTIRKVSKEDLARRSRSAICSVAIPDRAPLSHQQHYVCFVFSSWPSHRHITYP